MAKTLPVETANLLKDLVKELTGFEDGTKSFNNTFQRLSNKLRKSSTMYFANKYDIDKSIESMSEKYIFHGFFRQSIALKAAFDQYIQTADKEPELATRLNVIKTLLCLSEAPTKYFLNHPDVGIEVEEKVEESINWAQYLNEGIEIWQPNIDEDISEDESYNEGSEIAESEEIISLNYGAVNQIRSDDKMCSIDLRISREELKLTVQHSWYHADHFCHQPESQHREANIGILWENHLKEQIQGLIPLKPPSIITEYQAIREILWQLWCVCRCTTIEICGNNILPRPDVTLASVRSFAFYNFLQEFIEYIELMEFFREFENQIRKGLFEVCTTYQSYCTTLNSILKPVYKELSDLEDKIRRQETSYTLLDLADQFRTLFKPIKILKQIHHGVILSTTTNSSLACAITLIGGLHETLAFTTNKLEQDLKLALFMGSVRPYLNLTDAWLMKDDLSDCYGEFVIEKKFDHVQSQFVMRDELKVDNTFLKVFTESVLKVGRNVHFLRLLGKYDLIGESELSIYDEFISGVFKKLQNFYNIEIITPEIEDESEFIVDCHKMENMIDMEDGFLMAAFSDFFIKKVELPIPQLSLYERIQKATKDIFRKNNFFEPILLDIIERRFTISGLMVKTLLIEDHSLEKHFEFLKHLYLFHDDLIFPFYTKLFKKTESSNRTWLNHIWFTSHLRDIFMDLYPDFYDKCSIQLKDGWTECADLLALCNLLQINYTVPWPLDIIILKDQMELYRSVFHFLLKLKWALFTVNHLMFSDLNVKSRVGHRLMSLKFSIINILNSIQHFIFGFVFAKHFSKFELDFEKAYDLNSLIESHSEFIHSVSKAIFDVHQKLVVKDKNIFICVKFLKLMWTETSYATVERLNYCNDMYQGFHDNILPVIYPKYIYDY